MAVLFDFECRFCGRQYEDWTDHLGCTFCGGLPEKRYSQLVTHEWGGPRFIRSLQRTFTSRSSLNRWLKAHGMQQSPTADKRGGAHLGDAEAPRVPRIHFDPRGKSARAKGTHLRVDQDRK